MIWQDYVIALVQLGFFLALLPAVPRRASKPPLSTSLPTGIGLGIIAVTMATLDLWWSFATAGAAAVLWFIIAARTKS